MEGGIRRPGSLTIDPDADPSAAEVRAARLVADLGHDVVLTSPVGRRSPAGGTADLLVDGVAYDIFTPRTASVSRIVSAVARKGARACGVVVDLAQTTVRATDPADIVHRVRQTGSRVRGAIVIGGRR
jgi:hypothetical protein